MAKYTHEQLLEQRRLVESLRRRYHTRRSERDAAGREKQEAWAEMKRAESELLEAYEPVRLAHAEIAAECRERWREYRAAVARLKEIEEFVEPEPVPDVARRSRSQSNDPEWWAERIRREMSELSDVPDWLQPTVEARL